MDQPVSPYQCPVCLNTFRSISGKETHLSQAKSCQWYCLQELQNLVQDLPVVQTELEPEITASDSSASGDEEDYYMNYMTVNDIPNYHALIPEQRNGEEEYETEALPVHQPPRVLDDDNDAQYVETHPTAGKIVGKSTDSEGDTVMGNDEEGGFAPFSSELDWKIAEWAVKDSIGHNSLDRLLAIPGVCLF